MGTFTEENGHIWHAGGDYYYNVDRNPHTITATLRRKGDGQVRIHLRPGDIEFPNLTTNQILISPATSPITLPAGTTTDTLIWEIQRRLSGTTWQYRARARDFPNGAWTAWTSWQSGDTLNTDEPTRNTQLYIRGMSTARYSAFTIKAGNTGDGDFQPTARIGLTGYTFTSEIPVGADDAWAFIQETTNQTVGAAGLDENGHFYYIPKDRLRGVGEPSREVLRSNTLNDLPWSIDIEETADRVEVNYTPTETAKSRTAALTVWEAPNPIQVGAKKTVTIIAEHDSIAAEQFGVWQYDANFNATTYSRWHTYKTASGEDSGTPTGTELTVATEPITTTKTRIRITNNTSQTLWVRDENGGGYLILRAHSITTRGEQQQVAIGATVETALNPFTHDAGTSIQTYEDALSLASWFYAVLSEPLAVLEDVQVIPDSSRSIGQVVTIYDPRYTGLRARALIAGIQESGTVGQYTQTLRLALLATTIDDSMRFAESLTAGTTLGDLLDAVDVHATTAGASTTSIQDFINYWETESTVIT